MAENFVCIFCVEDFNNREDFERHKGSNEHRVKYLNRSYHTNRRSFVEDKNGLSISVQNDGPVEYKRDIDTICITIDEETKFNITLKYSNSDSIILMGADVLNEGSLLSSDTKVDLQDNMDVCNRSRAVRLRQGSIYIIECIVNPGSLWRSLHIPIIFQFHSEQDNSVIYYGKNLEIIGKSFFLQEFGDAIPGVHLPSFEGDQLERTLPIRRYYVSSEFTRHSHDNNAGAIRRLMRIDSSINRRNYENFFKTLLWLEELQLHLDIQYYSKKNVLLKLAHHSNPSIKCAELPVEGLSENRPSVLLGDKIMATPSREEVPYGILRRWYEGIVHKLTGNSVYLAFEQHSFMHSVQQNNGLTCDIEFLINRRSLQYCHRTIELCARDLTHLLFPVAPRHTSPLPNITLYNHSLSQNPEQMQAVRHIVAGSSHPSPYLIFGPPGTGKTVTVVEAIKQVLYHRPKSHVLACAPSNSAADIIAEYLLHHFTGEHVLRLYAVSREKYGNRIPQNIKDASNFGTSDKIHFPPKVALMRKRVIVCTYITAARIAAAQFPPNFFTHVFLDECGQAMEPEALVPIGGILSPQGHLIIAGDHHQLGPVVRSMQAKGGERNNIFPTTGLDVSYLERLMNMDLYREDQAGGFDPRLVTKLVYNYRSHRDILKVPNELFYRSQLQARGDPAITSSFEKWSHLPKRGFPLIFQSTPGQDRMTRRSPSYFNQEEINVVLNYVGKLLDDAEHLNINEDDIGIISPYRLQVEKIRQELKNRYPDQHEGIKVGSVEDFQGQERKVIIITTVRATKGHLIKDEIFSLGFLRNPKRFNVSITRAKSLLIIIGCANILQLDRSWRKLIKHIRNGGGYIGAPPPRLMEDLDSTLANLGNIDSRPYVGGMSGLQIVEAPSFTEE